MATLSSELRKKLYAVLDALTEEDLFDIEVRTIEGRSPEMLVGPTERFKELCELGDLPNVERVSLEGDSFGGWTAKYFIADRGIIQALRSYERYTARIQSAVRQLSSARKNNPHLHLSGKVNSALWVAGFESSEEARKFSAALDRLAFSSQSTGSSVRVVSPELKKPLLEAGTPAQDGVNHPRHYASESGLEAIEVIEAFFHGNAFLANTFKYIARAGKKGGEAKRLEDLRKARWYLEREIKLEEAREDR